MKSFGGTIYVFSTTTTGPAVSTISAPSGGTLIGLPGLPASVSANQDFYMLSSGSNGNAFDVLYILSVSSATSGTISKYSLVGGSWVANGTYNTTFGGFGLAAENNGSGAFLYITSGVGGTATNNVVKLSDTAGYNSAINIVTANNLTLYTAPAGTTVKGIAFAPTALPPPPLSLTMAVSRKVHGGAQTFDIDLPLTGNPSIECRSTGNNHTLVFFFSNNVTSGSAAVTAGTGTAGTPTFSGNTMTVPLTGVTDVQTITVTLTNVIDQFSQTIPSVSVQMAVLAGDSTGDRTVNSSDVSQTKARSGQSATSTSFRSDVTVDGTINSSDVSSVKSKSGHGL
jgi:hypothetical protein